MSHTFRGWPLSVRGIHKPLPHFFSANDTINRSGPRDRECITEVFLVSHGLATRPVWHQCCKERIYSAHAVNLDGAAGAETALIPWIFAQVARNTNGDTGTAGARTIRVLILITVGNRMILRFAFFSLVSRSSLLFLWLLFRKQRIQ